MARQNRKSDKVTQKVSETLYHNGSVWAVQTSTFSATDKLRAADLDKEAEDILDIFKLGKKFLLPLNVRKEIGGIRSKVNSFMDRAGKPFFLRGAYFIPSKNTLFVKEGLERMRAGHLECGQDLVVKYPRLKAEMIQKYPVLETAKWPTQGKILNQFKIKWIVFEVSNVGATEADPDELIAAKMQFRKELDDQYEKLKNEALKEARVALIESCDIIAGKILDTGDKITAATLKKPKSIIEKYSYVADLFELDDIKQKVRELEATLDDADAKLIRDDWGTAKAFGDKLKGLADDIDDLSGYSADGTVKRKIKFRKAA